MERKIERQKEQEELDCLGQLLYYQTIFFQIQIFLYIPKKGIRNLCTTGGHLWPRKRNLDTKKGRKEHNIENIGEENIYEFEMRNHDIQHKLKLLSKDA